MNDQASLPWWQRLRKHCYWWPNAIILLIAVALSCYLLSTDECIRASILCPFCMADGSADAEVFTWIDNNGNGIPEPDEPPLPWVTANLDYPSVLTDKDGEASTNKFKPGCKCRCWENESVVATTPLGYRPTTPTELDLTGQETPYTFGFQLEDETKRPSFPGEPDWFQAFTNQGISLIAFHYSKPDLHLSLSLEYDETWQDQEQLYLRVVDTIDMLSGTGLTIQTTSLAIPELKESIVCSQNNKYGWMGYHGFVSENCHASGTDD